MKDKQVLDLVYLKQDYINLLLVDCYTLSREEKQDYIKKHIDKIDVFLESKELTITNIDYKLSLFEEHLVYHKQVGLPVETDIFVDENNKFIPTEISPFKSKEEVKKYIARIVKYYEAIFNSELECMITVPNNEKLSKQFYIGTYTEYLAHKIYL